MKAFIILLLAIFVSSCTVRDKDYYLSHPQDLEKALQHCPNKQPELLSCDQLKKIAIRFNILSSELRTSPQKFGQTILALQEEISRTKQQIKKVPNQKQAEDQLRKNNTNLTERLIIVKVFESPAG